MRFYVRGERRACLACFRDDSGKAEETYDAILEQNADIAARIFSGIMDGSFSGAYIRRGRRMETWTRSTRGNFVQKSYFYDYGEGLEATSHSDIKAARDMDLGAGRYINITR